jgi:hypothetical protein
LLFSWADAVSLPSNTVTHRDDGSVETCHIAGGQFLYPGATIEKTWSTSQGTKTAAAATSAATSK